MPGWVSHIELDWALAPERRFFEALAQGRTLLRYDRPGCGLSGPAPTTDLPGTEMQVVAAVLSAVGVDQVDVLGMSVAAPLAVRWAASRPESVGRLVLYGGWVEGARLAEPAIQRHVLGLIEQHWGLGSQVLTEIFAPDADAAFRAAFAALQREAASSATARWVLASGYELSVSDELALVAAPTTVIHREGDRAAPVSEGRRLAAGITRSRLVVLPGRTHIAYVGDVDTLVAEIRSSLGLPRSPVAFSPRLTGRQLEVAALVSQGLSNREIGEALVITERSAESHVERIRTRLGLRSRAQLAAWYATAHE
jgi:pimeloyl-ACP methyl ester carboxylesterase/DNA-binding CsgD family transcriptional regulator